MAKRSTSFQILADLAEQQTTNSAVKLANLNVDNKDAQEKLDLLLQYREDYQTRFEASAQLGINHLEWQNYREFMTKLDKAIAQQNEVVTNAKHRVQVGKKEWQTNHRKQKTFDTLSERDERAKMRQKSKREQSEQDEHAAKAHVRKTAALDQG